MSRIIIIIVVVVISSSILRLLHLKCIWNYCFYSEKKLLLFSKDVFNWSKVTVKCLNC